MAFLNRKVRKEDTKVGKENLCELCTTFVFFAVKRNSKKLNLAACGGAFLTG